jgi:hypothetical protein
MEALKRSVEKRRGGESARKPAAKKKAPAKKPTAKKSKSA